MGNSSVAITPGSGVSVDSYQNAAGDQQQIVRQVAADVVSTAGSTAWTVSTSASTNQIAASEDRVSMLVYNGSTVRVYFRLDGTTPTAANAHWYLDSGERWEVPYGLCQLAVSVVAASAGTGTVNFCLGSET